MYNSELLTTALESGWAQILKNHVIKVVLDDAQATCLLGIKPGAIMVIHNLSIQCSAGIQACWVDFYPFDILDVSVFTCLNAK